MLEIKKISKTYITGDLKQVALNRVSLNFRDCEFVSILGPSGSGKTTLLNIIGGLDHYDEGDLVINSISTKKYKSKDWDSYRNHTIGFVFQNYNLIPHQTILSNVELALTISGISKKERRKRALSALKEVGLKEQAHKRPNQMSGGQMQRVAVARALVNNPDILLADEPTGALDSATSKQVMELLAKIAKDRLVIMVTHNPEIAEEYSTRIVKLKDGKVIDDSNPFKINRKQTVVFYKNLGKSSMSLPTAFGLSLNNLLTKKGRTILTSFAGSIGIIGIALILSLSNGFQKYIDKVQEDTLTSYPLTIQSETADTTSLLLSTVTDKDSKKTKKKNTVVEVKNLEKMFSSIGKNDMKSFKSYLDDHSKEVNDMTTHVRYEYSVAPNIYTEDVNHNITRINPSDIMNTLMGGMYGASTPMGFNMNIFAELGADKKALKKNYSIIAGKFPENYNEIVLLLPDDSHISDLLLYSLGLKDSSNLDDMIKKTMNGEKVETNDDDNQEFTYDDLLKLEFKLVYNADTYRYNANYNIYEDMSEDKDFMKNLYENAETLKVVGIIKPKDSNGMSALMSGVGYTEALTKHVIEESSTREIVQKQIADKDINVFSGKRFDDKGNDTGLNFEELITVDTDMLSSAFDIHIDENYIGNMSQNYMQEIEAAITADTANAKEMFHNSFVTLNTNLLNQYINQNPMMGMDGVASIRLEDINSIVDDYYNSSEAQQKLGEMEEAYVIPADVYRNIFTEVVKGFLNGYVMMLSPDAEEHSAVIASEAVDGLLEAVVSNEEFATMEDTFAKNMTEANMKKTILTKVGELMGDLTGAMANAFNVDQEKIAGAFRFNLGEDDIRRIFSAMTGSSVTSDANSNLVTLGYQDFENPTNIYFYFKNFEAKEKFIEFMNTYNKKMKKQDEKKVIEFTDLTGVLISSVKVIVDSVSYVLIAFVSISLIVSSIMIGIITYISVLERTKEIGILRAIGASKRNISNIFNAETCIIGFLSGLFGVGISLLLLIPINAIIHFVTNNPNVTAVLPPIASVILILLSTFLTLIGGLIPSSKAAKQDPVLALRSE
ncbi:MAG: ATP-binding cassette domain-containing protein [Bacilli bacterium]|nr:ATP-binding cassette domain-containing protein [Bacilli bacterium]